MRETRGRNEGRWEERLDDQRRAVKEEKELMRKKQEVEMVCEGEV